MNNNYDGLGLDDFGKILGCIDLLQSKGVLNLDQSASLYPTYIKIKEIIKEKTKKNGDQI